MKSLHFELLESQRESERLTQLNILHQKLAEILDLPTMIEAYSLWLMECIDHDLVGYNQPILQRLHMYCSYHGPNRRQAIQLGREVLEADTEKGMTGIQQDGFYAYRWAIRWEVDCGLLVLLRKGKGFSGDEQQYIEDSLAVLSASLNRTMEYERLTTGGQRDRLTELPNRFAFDERAPAFMDQARRHDRPLTLLTLHLEDFKEINNRLGWSVGDSILRQVAAILKKEARGSDFLAHVSAEGFFAVLPDTILEQGSVLAERLCGEISQLEVFGKTGHSTELAITICLSSWEKMFSIQEWIERKDMVYNSKIWIRE